MKDSQGNLVLGRTKWWRFAAVALPAAALGVGLMAGVANGAVPIALNVSGETFKVSADRLDGSNFRQYASFAQKPDKTRIPVAGSDIETATLTNLCQSVNVGGVVLVIRGGRDGKVVRAENLRIGLDQLGGEATFTNIHIGTDAAWLDGDGKGPGIPGTPGQRADRIVVDNLKQVAYSTSAGTFRVEGLSLKLATGPQAECFSTID